MALGCRYSCYSWNIRPKCDIATLWQASGKGSGVWHLSRASWAGDTPQEALRRVMTGESQINSTVYGEFETCTWSKVINLVYLAWSWEWFVFLSKWAANSPRRLITHYRVKKRESASALVRGNEPLSLPPDIGGWYLLFKCRIRCSRSDLEDPMDGHSAFDRKTKCCLWCEGEHVSRQAYN